ncbi:SDR family oxidoreductase [Streptomyces sp. M19]
MARAESERPSCASSWTRAPRCSRPPGRRRARCRRGHVRGGRRTDTGWSGGARRRRAGEARRVDVLVHNAGGAGPHKGALAIPDEEWQDALDLNFLASVRLDSLLAPEMRERRSGRSCTSPRPRSPPGTAVPALHGGEGGAGELQPGLAAELAPAGIRVNTVSPGRTATPAAKRRGSGGRAWTRGRARTTPRPAGRDGQPDDIAHAVLFLVSERASWLTGSARRGRRRIPRG